MSHWTEGYTAEIDYTFGYYPELNPLQASLILPQAEIRCPRIETACELGFGQGLSTNFHAAATSVEWWGTDFIPAQASFARELASIANSQANLFDDSFEDFCNRPELPEFDFIAMHGIWSWISGENRRVIIDFIRRKLRVGGLLYISYNTMPGWASYSPLRQLMTDYADRMGKKGEGLVSRINGALDFSNTLVSCNPAFTRANRRVLTRLAKVSEHDRHYLAHEYFNQDWHPMHFDVVARHLAGTKVDFACSANYLDQLDNVNLTKSQQAFIKNLCNRELQQSTRDFMTNQQFRRDYWIKGPRQITPRTASEHIGSTSIVLTTHRDDVTLKILGALGELTMQGHIYEPILDFLADYEPHSMAEIRAHRFPKDANLTPEAITEAVLILAGKGCVKVAQRESDVCLAKPKTDRLNDFLIRKSRRTTGPEYLLSPVTGGGIEVSRIQQIFAGASKIGINSTSDLAVTAWKIIAMQGQKIVSEGKTLQTEQEHLEDLNVRAEEFVNKRLPILKSLQVI